MIQFPWRRGQGVKFGQNVPCMLTPQSTMKQQNAQEDGPTTVKDEIQLQLRYV